MRILSNISVVAILLFTMSTGFAQVKPNSLFSDNAVLQRGVAVPVWGTAADGEAITVKFAGQSHQTVAKNGKWMVKLSPLKAGGPFVMTVFGSNTININNILVGDVWLCSGQSNMGFSLRSIRPLPGYLSLSEVLKDAQNCTMIRQFSIKLKKTESIPAPIDDVNGKWSVCDSLNAKNFSAVAYFFGRELYRKLNIPIGLVNSSYGGTAGENWASPEELNTLPQLKKILDDYNKAAIDFPKKVEKYKADLPKLNEKYSADSALAMQNKTVLPRKSSSPSNPAERGGPGGLYNTMIYPLMPYAIKGAVWYQGEANGSRGLQYRSILPAIINSWRKNWGIGDFPFLIVQIPGWKGHQPEVREAQLLTWQKIPNTTMTVITDCDDTLDVHPGNKQPVGQRVSLAALAIAYGEKIEYSGPVYQSMAIKANKIELSFTHIGSGLIAKNGELKDFSIAGADKKFLPAKAQIVGNKVVVYNDAIDAPIAVRLGWRLSPQVNLYNKEGLLATAFRTDVAP